MNSTVINPTPEEKLSKESNVIEKYYPNTGAIVKKLGLHLGELEKLYDRFVFAYDLMPHCTNSSRECFSDLFVDYMSLPAKQKRFKRLSYKWMVNWIGEINCWDGLKSRMDSFRKHKSE